MEKVLKEKLWAYMVHYNPDLLFSLLEEAELSAYLDKKVGGISSLIEKLNQEEKPGYLIEEACLAELTAELKPSRYRFILDVLEEEFPADYGRMEQAGTLTYEVLNIIEACKDTLDVLEFNEKNMGERHIRYAVIAEVHGYLN